MVSESVSEEKLAEVQTAGSGPPTTVAMQPAAVARRSPALAAQPSPPAADQSGQQVGHLGSIVLLAGVAGLAAAGFLPLLRSEVRPGDGALPACALVLTLLGFSLRFPTLLQDGSSTNGAPSMSTMRLSVLAIVSIIALVTVKAGWSTTGLAELRLDPSWAWLLAAALGGKAAQSFAENSPPR